jgi:hypothetical protein
LSWLDAGQPPDAQVPSDADAVANGWQTDGKH